MSLLPSNIAVNKIASTNSQAHLNSESPMFTKTLDHTLTNKVNAVSSSRDCLLFLYIIAPA